MQGLFASVVGALLVVASALDPAQARFLPWIHRVLVVAGAALIGAGIGGLLRRNGSEKDTETAEVFGEEFARRNGKALLIALFVVHLLATLFFFPPSDIVNDRPVVSLDHAFHYYQARRANAVFLETGRLHAYDPYFMAGFPSALFDLDVKMLELFCAPFPAGEVARAMKFFILACYLSMVFTIYAGCRLMRLARREALLAVALLLVYWHWGRPEASHFRYAGMFSFIFVSHLSILATGLFARFLRGGGAAWWLTLGPVVCFVHPTAVVLLAVPYASLVLFEHRNLNVRKSLVIGAWCAAVVVVNSIWILPLIEFAQAKTETNAFFQFSGVRDLARVLLRPACLPAVGVLALGLLGGVRMAKGARASTGLTISFAFVSLLFISAYGLFLPGVKQLEPGRFLLSATFFSAPLAGAGAALLLERWGRLSARLPRLRSLEILALLVLLVSPIVLSYLSARSQYKRRLTTTLGSEAQALVDAVERFTDPSARLMIEDGAAALYGDVHLPGMLPLYTGVEQIGGPYPYTFLRHHFATFEVDRTMGKPLAQLTAGEFRNYTGLYNIRWVATASRGARDFMERIAAEPVLAGAAADSAGGRPPEVIWRAGRYELWRIDEPPSFSGGVPARVSASFNRIEVELDRSVESLTLGYHWIEGLTATPPARISPVKILDDPVPFIRVEPNGATSILIEY